MYPTRNENSPYEKYVGIEPNTIKKLIIFQKQPISETAQVKLTTSDFDSGQNSTILVRERVRGSKLERAYKKRKGVLMDQSQHTITFLPTGTNKQIIYFQTGYWNTTKHR